MLNPDQKHGLPKPDFEAIPTDIEIASSLLAVKILTIQNNELTWGDNVDAKQGAFSGNMHHPLHQLYEIYSSGGFSFPKSKQYESTGKTLTDPVAPGLPESIPEVKMNGSPSDLIDHFLQNSESADLIKEKIKTAKKILLTGCVNVESAITLAKKLSRNGFRGELTITDISGAPLTLAKQIYQKFNFEKILGINLITRQVDLRKLQFGNIQGSPWVSEQDIVISDVLGHYFDEKDMETQMPAILFYPLKPGGLLLLRDMGEFSYTQSSQRHVFLDVRQQKNFADFQKWLIELFNIEVPFERIQSTLTNIWPDPNHYPRGMYLENMWDYYLTNGNRFEYVLSSYVVPEDVNPDKRYFVNMIFKKRENSVVENEPLWWKDLLRVDKNFQLVEK